MYTESILKKYKNVFFFLSFFRFPEVTRIVLQFCVNKNNILITHIIYLQIIHTSSGGTYHTYIA